MLFFIINTSNKQYGHLITDAIYFYKNIVKMLILLNVIIINNDYIFCTTNESENKRASI